MMTHREWLLAGQGWTMHVEPRRYRPAQLRLLRGKQWPLNGAHFGTFCYCNRYWSKPGVQHDYKGLRSY